MAPGDLEQQLRLLAEDELVMVAGEETVVAQPVGVPPVTVPFEMTAAFETTVSVGAGAPVPAGAVVPAAARVDSSAPIDPPLAVGSCPVVGELPTRRASRIRRHLVVAQVVRRLTVAGNTDMSGYFPSSFNNGWILMYSGVFCSPLERSMRCG